MILLWVILTVIKTGGLRAAKFMGLCAAKSGLLAISYVNSEDYMQQYHDQAPLEIFIFTL